MSKRTLAVLALLGALLLIVSACAPAATPVPKATVKVHFIASPALGALFIAQEEGYFAEQGIEIEWVPFPAAAEAIAPLSQGQLDVAIGAVSAGMFNAVAKGLGISLVADMGRESPPDACTTVAIMVRKELVDSGEVKSVADLKGKTIAINARASIAEYMTATLLESAGLTIEDVQIEIMPFPAQVEAIATGAIDAAYSTTPFYARMLAQGSAVSLVDQNQFAPSQPIRFIMYGPNLLEKDTALGDRFMLAYLKGVRQYRQGKTARNVEIIAKHTKLEPDFVRDKVCWPDIDPNAAIPAEVLLKFQDWMIAHGHQDEKVAVERFMDMAFVDHALASLGEVEQ